MKILHEHLAFRKYREGNKLAQSYPVTTFGPFIPCEAFPFSPLLFSSLNLVVILAFKLWNFLNICKIKQRESCNEPHMPITQAASRVTNSWPVLAHH